MPMMGEEAYVLSKKYAKNYTNEKINNNPNNLNLPTKTLTFDGGIYSLPSDVVNGQVSDVVIKGLTVNQLIKNGNFADGTTGWLQEYATLSSINNNLSITGSGASASARARANVSLNSCTSGKKVLLKAKCRVTNDLATTMTIALTNGSVSIGTYEGIYAKPSPTKDTWYDLSAIITIGSGYESVNPVIVLQHVYADGTTATGKVMEVKEIMAIDLTAHGLENLTVDQCNAKFPHWLQFGVKSTKSVRLRSVNEDDTKESIAYVNLPPGEELRSLPNGTKDEVNVTDGVATKRLGQKIIQESDITISTSLTNVDLARITKPADSAFYNNYLSGLSTLGTYPEYTTGTYDSVDNIGKFSTKGASTYIDISFPKGTTLEQMQTELAGTTLTYQLATPIVTKLPAQPPLKVFESGTVYAEPLGDPAESTLPSVELTVPVGNYNKFGIASHDYQAAAADWVLNSDEKRCLLLKATNAGGAANIIAPDAPGVVYVINNASEQNLTIKKSGGTGVTIATGKTAWVMHNGIDYMKITGEV